MSLDVAGEGAGASLTSFQMAKHRLFHYFTSLKPSGSTPSLFKNITLSVQNVANSFIFKGEGGVPWTRTYHVFLPYLRITNTFFLIMSLPWSNLSEKLKNVIKILEGLGSWVTDQNMQNTENFEQ